METHAKTWQDFVILGLPWVMTATFVIGCALRALVWYTVRRHEWFAREFEKRVAGFVEGETPGQTPGNVSFYGLCKRLLERTYYECFEVRERLKRRKSDSVMSLSDRVFLIRQGCAWLVKDVLKQVKFLKWTEDTPKLQQITRATLHQNPCFNRLFGLIPMVSLNDIISILPGLFVVAGILGTFVGIAKGLPQLGGMNLQDLDNTKLVMDRFLNEIAFAMQSSILGIAFSLVMHFWNTIFSPERVFASLVDRFETSMDLLWYRSDNNHYHPDDGSDDPSHSLASETLQSEVDRNPRGREHDNLRKGKAS